MLSGDNGILTKAADSKGMTEIAGAKEQAQIDILSWQSERISKGENSDLSDSIVKGILTGKSYVKTANDTSFITVKGEHEIHYSELYKSNSQKDNVSPEIEYGYANNSGVVDADTLIAGDIINYYYDKNKSPIQCEIIYNDLSHGLQAISLGTVRNVKLGFGFEDYENDQYHGTKHEDPKAIEAFKNGAPFGYENTDFEKARWSWNHALSTLNTYAQNYLGNMAINARCVGCLSNNIILSEDENSNMVTINNMQFKNRDNNIRGSYAASNGYTENISEDLKTLDTLGIVATNDGIGYWLCSRRTFDGSFCFYLDANVIYGDGCYNPNNMIEAMNNVNYGREYGLRPIFTLKSNIKIEKTGHQNFGEGALSEP